MNVLSQELILKTLEDEGRLKENVNRILEERMWLKQQFDGIACISKVFSTDANFFLIKMENVDSVYTRMLEEEILASRRDPAIPGCIRINVGNREENEKLINLLKSI
ncbi:Histidinol-phosphate aminotransferase [Chryseobacterium gleum]|uniref:Histidinol-phosphate aminotransferase n=1 Tax=Chryseobacterium gleum TaxID=250 RepID=A0A3S4QZE8_CHRGE|nr:aminotransferase class I/II-fold pyridoxal phosphate-dependent enzyme [Chryseobacterium gleum]VEE04985.1 Histidinol-phosphate aminotransferase [Chryseobacterium gleum]